MTVTGRIAQEWLPRSWQVSSRSHVTRGAVGQLRVWEAQLRGTQGTGAGGAEGWSSGWQLSRAGQGAVAVRASHTVMQRGQE